VIRRNAIYRPASSTTARYRVIYGGAGSGKSVYVAQDYIALLSKRRRRLIVFRKVARTIFGSTFTLFRDILDAMGRLDEVHVNESRLSFTFPNGSEILHAGLDDVRKLKSIAKPTDIWIEEATELDFPQGEMEEPDIAQIDLRLRGVADGTFTITFNPTQQAVKIFDYLGVPTADLPSRGYRLYDEGRIYVQHSTYLDNPFVGDEYVRVFRKLGGVMQAVYERGELVSVDAPDQLIRYEWVKSAFELEPEKAVHDGRQRMAIDVARFGDDSTTIGCMTGWCLDYVETLNHQDTTTTGRRAISIARERSISAELITVDTVGLGAGTADTMREEGLDVSEFIAGSSPMEYIEGFSEEAPQFNNLRSQAWYYLRTQLEAGRVSISPELPLETKQKLQEDLLAPRYRFGRERVIEVEPKDGTSKAWGIKRRLGRSPDHGDMLMMALFTEQLAVVPSVGYRSFWE